MKIKQKGRRERVDSGAGKPAPVGCDLAGQYSALLFQFNLIEVKRVALWRQVTALEARRASVKALLDVAGTMVAVSRRVA
jgi:hypothetical protein